MKIYKNVDEYIQKSDKKNQTTLQDVRSLIKHVVPEAEESIAYGMPAYSWKGKPLFYFAAMKGHLGIYPTPGPIASCKKMLDEFSTSKGCVRVPYTAKLPKNILKCLLKERVKEIKTI